MKDARQTGFEFEKPFVAEWQRGESREEFERDRLGETGTKLAEQAREIQNAQLERVTSKLGFAIVLFCKQRLEEHRPDFHMEDLRQFLNKAEVAFAPASPDRILRQLRSWHVLEYTVVNRAASLYRITQAFLPEPRKALR